MNENDFPPDPMVTVRSHIPGSVAMGMWGGEVLLLTIIKPIDLMSDFLPFESDPYASDYVIPWLEAQ